MFASVNRRGFISPTEGLQIMRNEDSEGVRVISEASSGLFDDFSGLFNTKQTIRSLGIFTVCNSVDPIVMTVVYIYTRFILIVGCYGDD